MRHRMWLATLGVLLFLPARGRAEPGQVSKLALQPGQGKSSLLLSYSGAAKFRLFKSEKQGSLVIEAEDLVLPPQLTRQLNAGAGDSPVLQVTPYNSQHGARPMVKLVVQLRAKVDVTSTDLPGRFLVEIRRIPGEFSRPAREPAPLTEQDELRARQAAARKSEEVAKKLVEVLSSPEEDKKYFGQKVGFEGKDVEVPDIFRLVGESSELNIIWDTDVEGQKTSLAVKDIPWDHLLDIVVQQKGFRATVMGNVVRIMTGETFAKQAEAKKKEITLSDELEPVIMAVIPLSFADATDMKKLIEDLIQEKTGAGSGIGGPGGGGAAAGGEGRVKHDFKRGKLQTDSRTNALIITNTKDSIERIRRLVRELDVPVPQVLIDSKIVIAAEGVAKTMGASWGYHLRSERGNSGPIGAFNGVTESLQGGTEGEEATSESFQVSADEGGKGGVFGIGLGASSRAQLFLALKLSEANNQSKTVASPRVIVNNNKKADISDGSTITLPIPGQNATFKDITAKLALSVTPQVTSHGSVQLKDLTVQKELPRTNGVDFKKLTTDVLVDSGSTLVLGGIYQFSQSEATEGIPLLKDLPFIGRFFRVDTHGVDKSELMVFITPQIIDPESSSQSL